MQPHAEDAAMINVELGDKMYWKITPYHTNNEDYWVGPAQTEADHRAALGYAQARLKQAWDQLKPGMLASVTIELCNGRMHTIDDDV